MQHPAPSGKPETLSVRNWEDWQMLVAGDRFRLMQQALTGLRYHQMERQLELASRRDLPRDDRLELIAESRGAVHMINLILTGGLDELVRNLLGLPGELPKAPEDYMATEWSEENS